jgi:hypothetical protein
VLIHFATYALIWKTRPLLGHNVKTNIKRSLSALVGANYATARLTQLARQQIEAIWRGLSAGEISQLDAWLMDQQMAAQGRAQIEWTYIRATLTSIQQAGGP